MKGSNTHPRSTPKEHINTGTSSNRSGGGPASGIRYLDLFSGCGGFRLALEQAGVQIDNSVHCEINKFADRVYRYHYPESRNLGDIQNVRAAEVIAQLTGSPDLITFGWPCTNNCKAGKCEGQRRDLPSGLIHEAMRLISELQPQFWIAENVENLLSVKEGFDIIETFQLFSSIPAGSVEYNVEMQVFDSVHYTGQSRRRTYFVGYIREGCPGQIFPILPENKYHIQEGDSTQGQPSYTIVARRGLSGVCEKDNLVFEGARGFRGLTAKECEILQGMPPDYTLWGVHEKKEKKVKMSDSQRFQMLGNTITIPIVVKIVKKLIEVFSEL
ncbi:MAG: DNA (cytosine-5-)-methyltransferase [Candidatus Aminicenantes bacterium]|nr:DNA (cytosine-5-)-methyltransferase [Candidatus Aminicenantes bacterium]